MAKTLATSALLLDALGPVKQDIVDRVLTDRALDGDAAATAAALDREMKLAITLGLERKRGLYRIAQV